MKKTLAILCICLTFTSVCLKAQTATPPSSSGQNFTGGTLLLSPGVGYGYDYGYRGSFFPAIGASLDDGLRVNAGPGTIGLGGEIAFKFGSYDYDFDGYTANYSETILAFRGTYHWTPPGANRVDLYGGIPIGVRIDHYSEWYPTRDVFGNPSYYNASATGAEPFFGLFIGASYYFNSRVGIFAELGYDVSAFTIGINFKLK